MNAGLRACAYENFIHINTTGNSQCYTFIHAVALKIPGHNEQCTVLQVRRVLSGDWLDSEVYKYITFKHLLVHGMFSADPFTLHDLTLTTECFQVVWHYDSNFVLL